MIFARILCRLLTDYAIRDRLFSILGDRFALDLT